MNKHEVIKKAMSILGSRKSKAKAEAARRNGAKSKGRPKLKPRQPRKG